MQNRRRNPGNRALGAVLLALIAVCGAGCGHGLRYRLQTNRQYIYRVDLKKGVAQETGVNYLRGMASSLYYIISPINMTNEGMDMKATVQPINSTDYTIKLDIGVDRFILTPDGEILNRIGPLGSIDWTTLFFRIPDPKPKIGVVWTNKSKGAFLGKDADIESKYQVVGYEKRQGRKCTHIRMNSQVNETREGMIPGGNKIKLDARQDVEGDIWFATSFGMPVEAKYTQKLHRLVSYVFTGQALTDVTEVSEVSLRLEPRKQ